MAVLTNPISAGNILSRFEDYVQQAANAGVVWGTNNKPFPEFPDGYFGGTTGGKTTEATGFNSEVVTADDIFNTLLAETVKYTRLRNLRAIKNMAGQGVIYDATAKAHLNSSYDLSVSTTQTVSSGQEISSTGLEAQLDAFRTAYNAAAQSNTVTVQIDVCHSSCHNSCHGSRSRR